MVKPCCRLLDGSVFYFLVLLIVVAPSFTLDAEAQLILEVPSPLTNGTMPPVIFVTSNVSELHIVFNSSAFPQGSLTTEVRIIVDDWGNESTLDDSSTNTSDSSTNTSGSHGTAPPLGNATRRLLINITRYSRARNISIAIESNGNMTTAVGAHCTASPPDGNDTKRDVAIVVQSVVDDTQLPSPPPCTHNVSDGSGLPKCTGPFAVPSATALTVRNMAFCAESTGVWLSTGWPDPWKVQFENIALSNGAEVLVAPIDRASVPPITFEPSDNAQIVFGLPLTLSNGSRVSVDHQKNTTIVLDGSAAAVVSGRQGHILVSGKGTVLSILRCALRSDLGMGFAGLSHKLLTSTVSVPSAISVTDGASLWVNHNTCEGSRNATSPPVGCGLVLEALQIIVLGANSTIQFLNNTLVSSGGIVSTGNSYGTAWYGAIAFVLHAGGTNQNRVLNVSFGGVVRIEGNRITSKHRGVSLVSSSDGAAASISRSLLVSGPSSAIYISGNAIVVSSLAGAPAPSPVPTDTALDMWITGQSGSLSVQHSAALQIVNNTVVHTSGVPIAMVLRVIVQSGATFELLHLSLLLIENNSVTFQSTTSSTSDAILGVVSSGGVFSVANRSSFLILSNRVLAIDAARVRTAALLVSSVCPGGASSFAVLSNISQLTISLNVVQIFSVAPSPTGSSVGGAIPLSLLFVGGSVSRLSPSAAACPLILQSGCQLAITLNNVSRPSSSSLTIFASGNTEVFGVLLVASSLLAAEQSPSITGNVVQLSQSAARLTGGIVLRITATTLMLSGGVTVEVSNNKVSIAALTTTSTIRHVLGLAVLLPRNGKLVPPASPPAAPGASITMGSALLITKNTVSVEATLTTAPLGYYISGAIYIGAELQIAVTTMSPTTLWVTSSSRLSVERNVVSSVTRNMNAIGVACFHETFLFIFNTSIVQVTFNTIDVMGTVSVASAVIAVHGVLVSDTSDVQSPPVSSSSVSPPHTISSNALMKVTANSVRVSGWADGSRSSVVSCGVAWVAGFVAPLAVNTRSRWIFSLNAVVIKDTTASGFLAKVDVWGFYVSSGSRGVGVAALWLMSSSSLEIDENDVTLSNASGSTTNKVATVLFNSLNTLSAAGAPAALVLLDNCRFSISLNVLKTSAPGTSHSAASGIGVGVTNSAGIAMALFTSSVIALDGNDFFGDGSSGRSGPPNYRVAFSGSVVDLTATSSFPAVVPPALVAPLCGLTDADAITYMSIVTVAVCKSSVLAVRRNVAFRSAVSLARVTGTTTIATTAAVEGAVFMLIDAGLLSMSENIVSVVTSGATFYLCSMLRMSATLEVSLSGYSLLATRGSGVQVNSNVAQQNGSVISNSAVVIAAVGDSTESCSESCSSDGSGGQTCHTYCTTYLLTPHSMFSEGSFLQCNGNQVSSYAAAFMANLGKTATFRSPGSYFSIESNFFSSQRDSQAFAVGTSSQDTILLTGGAYGMFQRNSFVLVDPLSVYSSCMTFDNRWSLGIASTRLFVRRNRCSVGKNAGGGYLLQFKGVVSGPSGAMLLMGSCDIWNSRVLVDTSDYYGAAIRSPLPSLAVVQTCETFSFTKSVVSSASPSPDHHSMSISDPMISRTVGGGNQSLTITRRPQTRTIHRASATQQLAASATTYVTPSTSRLWSTVTRAITTTRTALLSSSPRKTLSASVVTAMRGPMATTSLTKEVSSSLTRPSRTLSSSRNFRSISVSSSCAPEGHLSSLSPLFLPFKVLPYVHPTADFTPLLPVEGVLPGVWGAAADINVVSAVIRPSTSLPVLLCRKLPASPPQAGNDLQLSHDALVQAGAVIGNGTVSFFNASSTYFVVQQWSAAETFVEGEVLEVRFLLRDWFHAMHNSRAPCAPELTVPLAFITLGGPLSSAQQAMRDTVGAVSVVTLFFALLTRDGGGDLQAMILVSMMECTPQSGSVHKTLGSLRSLAPLLLEESYVGVIWGNLLLLAVVLAAQCVAMLAVLSFRQITSRWRRASSARRNKSTESTSNEGSLIPSTIPSSSTSSFDSPMPERSATTLEVNIRDLSAEHDTFDPWNPHTSNEDLLATALIPHQMPADANVLAEDAATGTILHGEKGHQNGAPEGEKESCVLRKNGLFEGEEKSAARLVAFPGILLSAAVYAYQGTLFAAIRLVQIYQPGAGGAGHNSAASSAVSPSTAAPVDASSLSSDTSSMNLFITGVVITVLLMPVPLMVVLVLHRRMCRSYHAFAVPLGRSNKRFHVLFRIFTILPSVECNGVMLPRGIGRTWGPFVSSCRPHAVWCALPLSSGWIMCIAALVQFSTDQMFCTSIIVLVACVNIALACTVGWLRPRRSYLLNVVLVLQLLVNAAALFVNAVSVQDPARVSDSAMIVIGVCQSALSMLTTFGTLSVALSFQLQFRRDAYLDMLWSVGPLCAEALSANRATASVCRLLRKRHRTIQRLIRRFLNSKELFTGAASAGEEGSALAYLTAPTRDRCDFLDALLGDYEVEKTEAAPPPRSQGGGGGGALFVTPAEGTSLSAISASCEGVVDEYLQLLAQFSAHSERSTHSGRPLASDDHSHPTIEMMMREEPSDNRSLYLLSLGSSHHVASSDLIGGSSDGSFAWAGRGNIHDDARDVLNDLGLGSEEVGHHHMLCGANTAMATPHSQSVVHGACARSPEGPRGGRRSVRRGRLQPSSAASPPPPPPLHSDDGDATSEVAAFSAQDDDMFPIRR